MATACGGFFLGINAHVPYPGNPVRHLGRTMKKATALLGNGGFSSLYYI